MHSQTALDPHRPAAPRHHDVTVTSRHVVNLHHEPGESDVGYENVAFSSGSGSIDAASVQFTGNALTLLCISFWRSCTSCLPCFDTVEQEHPACNN